MRKVIGIVGECPIRLLCKKHLQNPEGYEGHLEVLVRRWLNDRAKRKDILVTVPCDSTDAWILAAYQDCINAEMVENPWENVIAKKKDYHGIRIHGGKKQIRVYSQFLPQLCQQWKAVTEQCYSARSFEKRLKRVFNL